MLFTLRFLALRDDMELYALSAGMVFPRLVSSETAKRITNNWTDRQTDRQTDKQTNTKPNRQTDRQTDRQRDRKKRKKGSNFVLCWRVSEKRS